MADIITGTTSGFVNNIPDNTYAAVQATKDAVKDSRHDVITDLGRQVDAIDDTLSAALHQVSRDTMDVRAQVTSLGFQVRDGFAAASKDSEINALKTQVELAKQSTYLSDKIDGQGERTRELINRLREDDYGRRLIERNTELVAALDDGRHWHRHFDQGQWQALNSQLQAFQSQLQETRQGMVNFGTMAGVGQTSTSNNVR